MAFDLLLKGGHLIDPANNIDTHKDLGITEGKVAAVAADIPTDQTAKVVDVSDLHVVPGLIDIHTHLYATAGHRNAWAGDNSILPDGFGSRSGVTTMVDTGSAGWRNLDDFRYRVLDRFATRTFAYVNIVGMGMVDIALEQNHKDMDVERTAAAAQNHSDVIVGTKTAHYWNPDWTPVDRALAAGEGCGKPAMIDFGYFLPERPYWALVTHKLRPGDISTHMYHAAVPHIDADGKVPGFLHEARARGVIFDVGHGAGSFVFRNAVPGIDQGFYPDSISTDLHTQCMNGPMMDMATVMSKFLVMGMPLAEVIRASTLNPAREIGHTELGHLGIGAVADVAVLNLLDGDFTYRDVRGGGYQGSQRLFCELTLLAGDVVWDWNSRTASPYRDLGPDYGLRPQDEIILPPA